MKEDINKVKKRRWVTCELDHEQGCAHWDFEDCECECHTTIYTKGQ